MISLHDYKEKVYSEDKRKIDPFFGRWYRVFSVPLSRLLCRTTITPNQVTLCQIMIGLVACLLIVLADNPWWFLFAVVLLHLSYLLDCVDGEIARYKSSSSLEGVFLDKYAHAVLMQSMFMSIGLYFALSSICDSSTLKIIVICISWGASYSSFMPAHRLVLTVADALLLKSEQNQYDVENYESPGPANTAEAENTVPLSGFKKQLHELKIALAGGHQQVGWLVLVVKELFRHSTYLAVITVIALLLLSPDLSSISLIIWLGLCSGVILKEVLILYAVINGNTIASRYGLYIQSVEKKSE
ncbi:MAG: hypothetical protein ACI9WC_002211 [Arenicella sp.]|jgi:hypothetical protein